MPIRVRFDKNGWHHPAFGRLGRGKNLGNIYVLPDQFGERETIKVPVMDQTSKPPRQIGEKEITRFKYLPSTVEIVSEAEITAMNEEASVDPEAEKPVVVRPKVATPEALEKVTGAGARKAPQSAKERTTGRRSRRKAVPAEE